VNLKLPTAPLLSFPVEFVQGMKERGWILFDTGRNSPENWDAMWNEEQVHAWLGVYAESAPELERRCGELQALMLATRGAAVVGSQDAGLLKIGGDYCNKEHFGYTQGFGNPDYLAVERNTQPGQGKLRPYGSWAPIATGELLLGYPDEAGELPAAPIPNLLAKNGSFMVYRKLHQNVATFRSYLEQQGRLYPGGVEKLASKFIGRWRDGTPVELSPDAPDPALVSNPDRNTDFTYGRDLAGARCPLGAHVRRANPRDAFGFHGALVNRRRITRRGLPYGAYTPEGGPVSDEDEHGMIFMALNVSISRQFEYVCQQWIEYGNDARQGSDKDVLVGNHEAGETFMIQGTADPRNPPFLCGGLPNFVELRGGEYFYVPSITALKMMATGAVDPY
jgi:Dyp-type peroxidase family